MSEFTLKTRLLAALEGKPVDKIPVCSVTQTGIVELMDVVGAPWPEAHTNPELMAKLAIANHELSGLEAVRIPYCLTVLVEAMGCEINMGTKNRQPYLFSLLKKVVISSKCCNSQNNSGA